MKITTRYGQCHKTDCDQCVRGWCQWPCPEREHAIAARENAKVCEMAAKDSGVDILKEAKEILHDDGDFLFKKGEQ